MEIEKITFQELGERKGWEEAVIVISNDSWKRDYSLESRSYKVSGDAKYFNPAMIGRSLYGYSLDGSDNGVRIDWYLHPEEGKAWEIEYCYITKLSQPEEGEYDGEIRENPSGYVGFTDGVK